MRRIFKDTFLQWIRIMNRKECASILNLSKRNQIYRIVEFINDRTFLKKHLKKPNDTQFISINIGATAIEDEKTFQNYLNKHIQKNKKNRVIFILHADLLLTEKPELIGYMNDLHIYNPSILVFYFFEKNIMLPQHVKKLSRYSTLYKNIVIVPYLDPKKITEFMLYLEDYFKARVPQDIMEKIQAQCGNRLWLITEALRYYIKTHDTQNIFNREEFLLKIKTIYEEYEPIEKQVFEKIIRKDLLFNQEERSVIRYFITIRLLTKQKTSFSFNVPLLEKYIQNQLFQKTRLSLTDKNTVTINDIVIEYLLSKRERRLVKYLLQHSGEILSREETATLLWGNHLEKEWTDWALDQAIRRLRNKFEKLGIRKNTITTIKNRGFALSKI